MSHHDSPGLTTEQALSTIGGRVPVKWLGIWLAAALSVVGRLGVLWIAHALSNSSMMRLAAAAGLSAPVMGLPITR